MIEKQKAKIISIAADILSIADDFTDEYTSSGEALEAVKTAVPMNALDDIDTRLAGIEASLDAML